MSRATETAEREAAEAEAENPDAEPEEPIQPDEPDEEEQEAEEEPAEPSSLAQVENIDKSLETESRRHSKALAKALGEQWEHFAMCPLCQVDGYAMQYQPGEIGPEQREAILTVMGESGPGRFKEHPTEVRCEVCDGWGEMTNGSRRTEQASSACQTCMGTGHVPKAVPQPENVTAFTPPAWTPPPPAYDPSMVNADAWGRPIGHADYGLNPAEVVGVR